MSLNTRELWGILSMSTHEASSGHPGCLQWDPRQTQCSFPQKWQVNQGAPQTGSCSLHTLGEESVLFQIFQKTRWIWTWLIFRLSFPPCSPLFFHLFLHLLRLQQPRVKCQWQELTKPQHGEAVTPWNSSSCDTIWLLPPPSWDMVHSLNPELFQLRTVWQTRK